MTQVEFSKINTPHGIIYLTTFFSQEEDFFLDFPPSKVNMERAKRQQSQRKLLIMKFAWTIIWWWTFNDMNLDWFVTAEKHFLLVYLEQQTKLEAQHEQLESKHLKGHSAPRVGDGFPSHLLGKLSVTVFHCTFLASCWWRFSIAPSWQAVDDGFPSQPLGQLLMTVFHRTFLANCW